MLFYNNVHNTFHVIYIIEIDILHKKISHQQIGRKLQSFDVNAVAEN